MADYEYTDLSAAPSLEKIQEDIADSAMTNKDIGEMSYVPNHATYNKYLTIHFDVSLSSGDKTILDSIVLDSLGYIWKAQSDDISDYLDDNAIVVDALTGLRGLFHTMQTMMNRRELYNDQDSPLYDESVTPILGESGHLVNHANRINSLEIIHGKLGWHNQEVLKATYQKPKDLLIYYGWLNSFNSATNSWVNEKVAQDMAKYSILVFGDGIQDPSHGDYSNTQVIIPRIKALNPYAKIFGYVSVNQSLANFQTKVSQWETLQVDGIFMDEAGYDYGTVDTNGRAAFNTKVDYVHGKTYAKLCFANAWNMDHIIGTTNDPSYPNSTWNSSLTASKLTSDDYYLLESFPINTTAYSGNGGYENKSDWASRGTKAIGHRNTYGINLIGSGIINNGNSSGQDLFDFGFNSSVMFSLEGWGTSDTSYGASSAAVDWWTRPDVSKMGRIWSLSPAVQVDVGDSDVYWRFVDFGKFMLDFSSSAQDSSITKW
jgi:hypothetical protein